MAHPIQPSDDPTDDSLVDLRPLAAPTWRDRVDDLRDRIVDAPVRAVGTVLAVVVAAAVAWWLLRPPPAPPIETRIPLAGEASSPDAASGAAPDTPDAAPPPTEATATTVSADEVVVQAAGAVREPGVYRLDAGSRVDDLVTAAGGLASNADPDRVNLAAPLADGQRVWLPRQGEDEPPEIVAGSNPSPPVGPAGTAGAAPTEGAPIDINTASAVELEALSGVGPATAAAIVAHRDEHGPFATVDELLDVRGIGDAKLEQIRPQATVG